MTPVKKGDRVRARWFRTSPRPVALAGMQLKAAASLVEVEGTVRHVRGDHPTAPSEVRLFLDCNDSDLPLVRPPGCTCPRGHAEVKPSWVTEVLGA